MYFNITIFLFLFGSAFSQAPNTNTYLRNATIPILQNNPTLNYNDSQPPRELNRRKRIGRIVRTGLKIAIIAKTGGVAALKTAAAKKLKEIAVRKGIQCLKNGFSNFCNGKKKVKTITKRLKTKRIPPSKVSKKKTKTMIHSPTVKRKRISTRIPIKKINRKKTNTIRPNNSSKNATRIIRTPKPIRRIGGGRRSAYPSSSNTTRIIRKTRPIRRRTSSPTGSPSFTGIIRTTIPSRRVRRGRRTSSPTSGPSATGIVRTARPSRRIRRGRTTSPTGSPSVIGIILTAIPSTRTSRPTSINVLSTRNPSQGPSRIPTIKPSPRPTIKPSQQPTITKLNWNTMFSSSPTPLSKIPPTPVPTNSMFTILSGSLTRKPTAIKTNLPTAINTKTPTRIPTRFPTSKIPTPTPTIQPTTKPTAITQIPTVEPTITTDIPTNGANTLSTNSVSISQQPTTTNNIIIAISVLVIFVILIAMTVYFLKKKQIKLEPYQKWIDYYDKRNTIDVNDDIHHFYRKSNHAQPHYPAQIAMSKLPHQVNSV